MLDGLIDIDEFASGMGETPDFRDVRIFKDFIIARISIGLDIALIALKEALKVYLYVKESLFGECSLGDKRLTKR